MRRRYAVWGIAGVSVFALLHTTLIGENSNMQGLSQEPWTKVTLKRTIDSRLKKAISTAVGSTRTQRADNTAASRITSTSVCDCAASDQNQFSLFDRNDAFGYLYESLAPDPFSVPPNTKRKGGRLRSVFQGVDNTTYDLTRSKYHGQFRDDRLIMWNFFSNMKVTPPEVLVVNGTFLEIGAHDGLDISNTAFFEDYLGWSGMLIEADPANFKALVQNRGKKKSALVYAASNSSVPQLVKPTKGYNILIETAVGHTEGNIPFSGKGATGGVVNESDSEGHAVRKQFSQGRDHIIHVRQMPMSAVFKRFAPDMLHIDLMSVDMEGSELGFIQTFPWSTCSSDGVSVGIMVVEVTTHRKEIIDDVHRLTSCGMRHVHDKGPNAFFVNHTYLSSLLVKA